MKGLASAIPTRPKADAHKSTGPKPPKDGKAKCIIRLYDEVRWEVAQMALDRRLSMQGLFEQALELWLQRNGEPSLAEIREKARLKKTQK